jgi:hypothetical protein
MSRRKTSEALMRFAVTEYDSAWQNLYAIPFVEDAKLRAKMFQHVIEEVHHGSLFKNISVQYADNMLAIPSYERMPLFNPRSKNAVEDFFGYEQVGEKDVAHEFGAYGAAAPYQDIKAIFKRLEEDEVGHTTYTTQVFQQLSPSLWKRAYTVVKTRLKRFYESWVRVSLFIGKVPSTVILGGVYFVFGSMLHKAAVQRLRVTS